MKNGIVILNYLNMSVTFETVKSLLTQNNIDSFHIVIVDNGSKNGSIEYLSQNFSMYQNITVLEAISNLGYAQGNNVGINYLRERNIDNVLVMNSDISFSEANGLEQLFLDIPNNVGVIGPNIIGNNNAPANPIRIPVGFKDTLIRFSYNSLRNIMPMLLKENVKRKTNNLVDKNIKSMLSNSENEFFVHGAAYILTHHYFNVLPELYPKTFLYYEAQILKILSNKFHLNYFLNANIKMKHIEDQSSKFSFGNKKSNKQRLVAKSQLTALILYIKLLRPQVFLDKWNKK